MAKVVVFTEYGGPEKLHIIELEDPLPAAGNLRIRVRAAGVQPFDAAYRRGTFAQYQPAPVPARLGNEVAGVIDAVGAGVSDFATGDAVIAFVDAVGYADVVIAPAAHAVRKPVDMPWSEAGVLSASGQTADTALDALEITTSDSCLSSCSAPPTELSRLSTGQVRYAASAPTVLLQDLPGSSSGMSAASWSYRSGASSASTKQPPHIAK